MRALFWLGVGLLVASGVLHVADLGERADDVVRAVLPMGVLAVCFGVFALADDP